MDRPERDGIAELESYLVNTASDHAGCDIFVMGDFNARTSGDEDYILDDDVTYVPGADEWYVADTFCHPVAQETVILQQMHSVDHYWICVVSLAYIY